MDHLTGEPADERPIPASDGLPQHEQLQPQQQADRDPFAADGFARPEPGPAETTLALSRGPRAARDPLAADLGAPSGGNARVLRVTTSDYLLTVNPVDGTEVTLCPPADRPVPQRRTREERVAHLAAGRPSPPPGPPAPELPLLERDEERERLIRLLARGRSVRVTGPSGAGRTALLESVANACADLAPDGVLWLSGYRRTPADVLQELFATVYAADGHRPDRAELPGLLRETGAVVVVDDLEFGGAALEELLSAAPECAFLMSATPDVTAPSADSMIEEVFLSGLTRVACVDLLQFVTGRPLSEDETAWAADLWFESEGLPLRFVQAGALLRQRDALRQPPEPDWDDSVWENGSPAAQGPDMPPIPDLTGFEILEGPDAPPGPGAEDPADALPHGLDTGETPAVAIPPVAPAPGTPAAAYAGPPVEVPLPSLAESAAPAELLASRLSESAREALAFAVALDGECPHPSHLPALVGDTHGDAALGELTAVGLAVPVAAHFRLAAGVVQQIAPRFTADGELSEVQAHTAALHYAWWTGHPSVAPERAAAESEAILAAMSACRDNGNPSAAVLLARTVAPAFAAALHWGAWERALRIGQEAARLSGEVAEEAYFHHELGVLSLCTGHTDRARAELEASIALRGALADRQGTVVGRRTLALVNDRDGGGTSQLPAALLELPPGGGMSSTTPLAPVPSTSPLTVISKGGGGAAPRHDDEEPGPRRLAIVGTRRNLMAVATGVVLAGVLGTIVTLGATSGKGDNSTPNQVQPIESAQQDDPATDTPSDDTVTDGPTATSPSATSTSPTPSTPGTTVGTTTAPYVPPAGGETTSAPGTTPPTPPKTVKPTHTKPTPSHTSPSPSETSPSPTDTSTSPTDTPTPTDTNTTSGEAPVPSSMNPSDTAAVHPSSTFAPPTTG
ncbi:ATP-binding protein [Actinacidiphila alni]|uniref:ATP-binding protein n=1 Tax=Actinacidiphila alni TaxID=380248 RepID=UPI0033ED9B6F